MPSCAVGYDALGVYVTSQCASVTCLTWLCLTALSSEQAYSASCTLLRSRSTSYCESSIVVPRSPTTTLSRGKYQKEGKQEGCWRLFRIIRQGIHELSRFGVEHAPKPAGSPGLYPRSAKEKNCCTTDPRNVESGRSDSLR